MHSKDLNALFSPEPEAEESTVCTRGVAPFAMEQQKMRSKAALLCMEVVSNSLL